MDPTFITALLARLLAMHICAVTPIFHGPNDMSLQILSCPIVFEGDESPLDLGPETTKPAPADPRKRQVPA